MMPQPAAARYTPRPNFAALAVPTLGAVCALIAVATGGVANPLAWVIAAALVAAIFGLALLRMPLVLLWLVPTSMCVHYYLPMMHYEALVVALGISLAVSRLQQFEIGRVRLDALEARYAIFLLTLLPGLLVSHSLWRFGSAFKIYVLGWVAFEVARYAAARYGRILLLVGPALLCGISAVQLLIRVARSGIPAFKSVELRVYLSDLSWGTSNYVAAVFVLCLPTLLLLAAHARGRFWARMAATGTLIGTLAGLLITNSRGGALLSSLLLGSKLRAVRRRPIPILLTAAVIIAALVVTPYGQGLLGRFASQKGADSLIFRTLIWRAAFLRGWTHLPFGLGAGQGLVTSDRLQEIDAHNFLLTLFSEAGPLAVAAWGWLLAAAWKRSRVLRADPRAANIGNAMTATLVLAIANSMFEPTFTGNLYHLLFWWIVGTYYAEDVRLPGAASGPA